MATKSVSKFTGSREFSLDAFAPPQTLIVDAGTGTVTLEVMIDTVGAEYILHETYNADGVHKVEANGCSIRITCTGDAAAAFVRP